MITLLNSFSVRAQPLHAVQTNDKILHNFAVKMQGQHSESGLNVITERFNAGAMIRHLPEGDAAAVKTFAVAPSGFDVFGTPMPEHVVVETDVLRYHSNG